MPITIVYGLLGGAVLIAIIALVIVKKKTSEFRSLLAEKEMLEKEFETKLQAFTELEKNFEEKVDEVVQSSIQKISHAEEAKDEAIKAAQDNYEAAAEAHAQIKEREAQIQELQSQLQ